MLSVIESEAVLDAAREMNRRDVLHIELEHGLREKDNDDVDTEELIETDDEAIWARTEGVDGLRGASGDRLKIGGSHYSYGPYPRNRRVLADIALAAGWSMEKIRTLERAAVQEFLLDPNQPLQNGKPFTFQHVTWSYLPALVEEEMEEMDPGKMAAVKAAVVDRYEANSMKGKKILPVYDRETKRISDSDFPVSECDVERAQEAPDKEARHSMAVGMSFHDKNYMPPEQVKRRLKAYIVTHNMSEADVCP